MQDSKKCFKCRITKPLSEFYRHRAMADGHLGKCKDCTKADASTRRKNNLESVRAYDRERNRLPHRRLLTTKSTKEVRKRVTGYNAAHCAVQRAVQKGVIKKKPCEMCGSIMSVAHHDDYARPLDVMWLCQVHHKSRHAFLDYMESEYCQNLERT